MHVPISQLAVQVAASQLGQREQPKSSNSGPMVDKYLASVGLGPGYYWCMAFVYWCYNEASRQLLLPNPVPRTAGVLKCWNNVPLRLRIARKAAIANPEMVKPGAQFFMDYGKGQGHTGIVLSVQANGTITTIEGNSNVAGSRNGEMVVERTRNISDKLIKGFVNYE